MFTLYFQLLICEDLTVEKLFEDDCSETYRHSWSPEDGPAHFGDH